MSGHRLCVAPMMDWTDRHCRFFLRQLSARAFLYTEMITTGALIHGDVDRHLAFSREEHPVAAQLGGSEPDDLAKCARLVQGYGYDEVNLNCGCPSERVQKGSFGACLMAEPALVADCVRAMKEKLSIPVTVKHRTGIDRVETYDFLARFVDVVSRAGCSTFFVHARNAILKGLSPKENREVPPLKYEYVYRLKRDFPHLEIVINGGITRRAQIEEQLARVDGVMLGRAAYADPSLLAEVDGALFRSNETPPSRLDVLDRFVPYVEAELKRGARLNQMTRHILGLFHGRPRARAFRRHLAEHAHLEGAGIEVLLAARAIVAGEGRSLAAAE
jgi:tRNA-dihydrouridine synthase A